MLPRRNEDLEIARAASIQGNSQTFFSDKSSYQMLDAQQQNLELAQKLIQALRPFSDDDYVVMMNNAIERGQFNLKEAADLFYALALANPAEKELCGAAMTLLLKAAESCASACEWYMDRFREFRAILSKLKKFVPQIPEVEFIKSFQNLDEKSLELIERISDPSETLATLGRNIFQENCNRQDIVGALCLAFTRRGSKESLNPMQFGHFPILLNFFSDKEKNNPAFVKMAKEYYVLIEGFRKQHFYLLSIIGKEQQRLGRNPEFMTESLLKFSVLVEEQLQNKPQTFQMGFDLGNR